MSASNRFCVRNSTRSVHARGLRVPAALRDPLRVDVDADAARAVALRGRDHDAAVAAAEVVDDVAALHLRQLQHRVDDFRRGRHERHVLLQCGRRVLQRLCERRGAERQH
jgi:hypothetical protein